jgi:hypothetical protein
MAQLKDSLITGDLRVTGTIYGKANLSSLIVTDTLDATSSSAAAAVIKGGLAVGKKV